MSEPVQPAYEPINICLASNENYAPHLAATVYSLLKHRDQERLYDILILHKDIREETKKRILKMEENGKFSIRFLSMEGMEKEISYDVGAYYSIETNYRLLLLGKRFEKYDKMLYLDCDLIVEDDISKLYDAALGDCEAAAVRSEEFRLLSKIKKPVFLDGYPYNVDNYRTDALGMKSPENYFNAGVLVIDLKKARQRITWEQIPEILHRHNYYYNDQDVLNILFDGRVKNLDCAWNYMTYIAEQLEKENENNRRLYEDLYRENPHIIHYTSAVKPWNDTGKVFGDRYWKYRKEMEEKYA